MSLDLKRSVVLVGMMGCGKSAIGYRLALALEIPFIDLDKEIEKNEDMSVVDIFSQKGEEYFRQLEKNTIEDILNSKICILATGGGAFINEQIRDLVKQIGISVYIKADFEVLLERVSRKNTRPLLEKGNKAEILKNIMDSRCHIYEEADITVDSSVGIHEIVVDKIIEEVSEYI